MDQKPLKILLSIPVLEYLFICTISQYEPWRQLCECVIPCKLLLGLTTVTPVSLSPAWLRAAGTTQPRLLT